MLRRTNASLRNDQDHISIYERQITFPYEYRMSIAPNSEACPKEETFACRAAYCCSGTTVDTMGALLPMSAKVLMTADKNMRALSQLYPEGPQPYKALGQGVLDNPDLESMLRSPVFNTKMAARQSIYEVTHDRFEDNPIGNKVESFDRGAASRNTRVQASFCN
jgi:hypothetical protein